MFKRTSIRVAGAVLCAATLMGAGALPAHADATGDAALIADAFTSDAFDIAAAALANPPDPNTSCDATAEGTVLVNGVSTGVAQVFAEEEADGRAACVSLTESNYTLTGTLAIENDTGNGVWVPVCSQNWSGVTAAGAAVAAAGPLECADRVAGLVPAKHMHRAHIHWVCSVPGKAPGDFVSLPYPIMY